MSIQHQYLPLNVVTPINTPANAPLITQGPVVNSVLNRVELRIPPGHGGLTGIYVAWGGVAIVPFTMPPVFIVGDDELLHFDVDEQIGGTLTVVTYNTDVANAHTFYLRFDVTPFALLGESPLSAVAAVPIA